MNNHIEFEKFKLDILQRDGSKLTPDSDYYIFLKIANRYWMRTEREDVGEFLHFLAKARSCFLDINSDDEITINYATYNNGRLGAVYKLLVGRAWRTVFAKGDKTSAKNHRIYLYDEDSGTSTGQMSRDDVGVIMSAFIRRIKFSNNRTALNDCGSFCS